MRLLPFLFRLLKIHVSPQHLTGLFIVLVIVQVVVYDIVMVNLYGTPATISGVCRAIAEKWPLFPVLVVFAMGCLIGHFFLQ